MTNIEPINASAELVERHSPLARMSAPQLQAESLALVEVMQNVLIENSHYGRIPGTQKPSLFKAGAEWLLKWAGYGHQLDAVEVDRDAEGRKYGVTYRASVFAVGHPGAIVATCDGYCGYDEPDREAHVTRNGKQIPRASWNTIIKMAEKRALVGAALQACGASGLFTQDMEDYGNAVQANEPPAAPVDWWAENGWQDESTGRKANAELLELLKGQPDDVRAAIKEQMRAAEIDPAKQWTKAQHDTIESWLAGPPPEPDAKPTKEEREAADQAHNAALDREAALVGIKPPEVEDIVEFVKQLKAPGVDEELTKLRQHCEGPIDERRRRLQLALLRDKLPSTAAAAES